MASDNYHWLAKYYDHLFEFRRPFTAARKTILGPIFPGVASACDLCCGTGEMALLLAKKGIHTFAVDLSPEMCRITRKKAREQKIGLNVIEADMRNFKLPQLVDLITCEFDALNHLPRKQDLKKALASVSKSLRPGGYFFFDVNNQLAFERIWANTWFLEKDPVVLVMHGGHKPGSSKAWTDVEWFVRTGKYWKRYHEHIEEVCWSPSEMRQGLKNAGFDLIRSWDAAPFFKEELTRPGNRTFWLARSAFFQRSAKSPLADYLRDFIVERYHEDSEDLRAALDRLADPKAALTSSQLRKHIGLDG